MNVYTFMEFLTAQGHKVELRGGDRSTSLYVNGKETHNVIGDRCYPVKG